MRAIKGPPPNGAVEVHTQPSSDGPTLPNSSEPPLFPGKAIDLDPNLGRNHRPSLRKKRRREAEAANTTEAAEMDPTVKRVLESQQNELTQHLKKLQPWNYIPGAIHAIVANQHGADYIDKCTVTVRVYPNSHMNSTISQMRTILLSRPGHLPPGLRPACSTRNLPDNTICAVVAEGQGTTKLVSCVGILKRELAPKEGDTKAMTEAEKWFSYTQLTDRVAKIDETKEEHKRVKKQEKEEIREIMRKSGMHPRGRGERKRMQMAARQMMKKAKGLDSQPIGQRQPDSDDESDEEEAFQVVDGQILDKRKERKVPIMIVWLSKVQIPEFKDMFTEASFLVWKADPKRCLERTEASRRNVRERLRESGKAENRPVDNEMATAIRRNLKFDDTLSLEKQAPAPPSNEPVDDPMMDV